MRAGGGCATNGENGSLIRPRADANQRMRVQISSEQSSVCPVNCAGVFDVYSSNAAISCAGMVASAKR